MKFAVQFHSYFKDLTGTSEAIFEVSEGSSLGDLISKVQERFPKMKGLERSTLTAVGVEYQRAGYVLQPGDEVSLFPPVQGG